MKKLEKLEKIKKPALNEKWQFDILNYEENRDWRILSEKFALAIMRLLRHQNKSQLWLANKLDKSPQYISRIIKGKENLSLKSMANIQSVLEIEILSIKNIDLAIKYQNSTVFFLKNSQEYTEEYESIDYLKHSLSDDFSISFKALHIEKDVEAQTTQYYNPIKEECL